MLSETTNTALTEQRESYIQPKVALVSAVVVIVSLFCYYTFGTKEVSYGLWSLLPVAVVVTMAIYSKRTVESLFIGVIVGLLMTQSPTEFIPALGGIFLKVFQNDTVAWIFIACGLMGSIISLITFGGGADAFGNWLSNKVTTRKGTLFSTMGLGLIIFIDDYLNALTIGSSLRKATDKVKVSREFLAYVVDSTAAPVCIILPFSTWAVFFSGLLEENGVAAEGEGIDVFISAIPYMVYAWVCLIVVALVINRNIPLMGKMLAAEQRVQSTGKVTSDDDQHLNAQIETSDTPSRIYNFSIPVIALIFFTWLFDLDIMAGAIATIFVTIALFTAQNLLPMRKMFDAIMSGFIGMIAPLGTLFCGFMLAEINDSLGTTSYVIESASTLMNAQWLPVVVFLTMAALAFATASFWGIFVVGMPIVMPLAMAVDANIPLVIGALISASAFGSHACFYGDSTVLSAKACGISPMNHALTQLPYTLIAAAVSAIIFILLA